MGRGGACCDGDGVNNGDENRLDDMDDETRAKAEAKLEEDNDYEPSSSGRVPGSKYTITEIDIMDCEDKASLEKTVKEHAATSRGESSCCGGKGGILTDWNWVGDLATAATQIRCGSVPQSFRGALYPVRVG